MHVCVVDSDVHLRPQNLYDERFLLLVGAEIFRLCGITTTPSSGALIVHCETRHNASRFVQSFLQGMMTPSPLRGLLDPFLRYDTN